MAEWPDWHPPDEMIGREPYLPRFMAGGEGNPLGGRALYLGKSLYRIHGTNQPSTIGTFVSSAASGLPMPTSQILSARCSGGLSCGRAIGDLRRGRPPRMGRHGLITSSARARTDGGTARPKPRDAGNARHPGWVALGVKVSLEPTSVRRCGSPSPLLQRIRMWREHLSPSSRQSSRFQTNCLPRQRPGSQLRRPSPSGNSNSAMTSQSWWPKVKYQAMSLRPTALRRVWQRHPHDFLA